MRSHPACHSERSEESSPVAQEILRCAQNDRRGVCYKSRVKVYADKARSYPATACPHQLYCVQTYPAKQLTYRIKRSNDDLWRYIYCY